MTPESAASLHDVRRRFRGGYIFAMTWRSKRSAMSKRWGRLSR
jgi:hypothetical protein